MNRDQELQLQAYMDGELSRAQAQRIENGLLASNEGRQLLEELRWIDRMLASNEPGTTVPETREFYWSRIEHGIALAEAAAARRSSVSASAWLSPSRWLAPVSGFAIVCVLALAATQFFDFSPTGLASGQLARVESPSKSMESYSFESKSENVFVIWLYERSPEVQPEMSYLKDLVIQ